MSILVLKEKVENPWGIINNGVLHNKKESFLVEEKIDGPALLREIGEKDGNFLYSIERWAHLHGHSGFSLLDGMVLPKNYAKHSPGIAALTDHGMTSGLFSFQQSMKAEKKKWILGVEVYTESLNGELDANHLIILVKDKTGYLNLLELLRRAEENFYNKPQVRMKDLVELKKGLIILSGCLGGEVARRILQDNISEAEKVIRFFKTHFKEDYYLEIQNHGIKEEEDVIKALDKLSKDYGIKLVATTDSHYISKEDVEAHEILLCIGTKTTMKNPDRFKMQGDGYHIHSFEEVMEKFKGHEEAVFNTLEVANKCNFEIETGSYHMPIFPIPKEFKDDKEYMLHLCREGFKKRFSGSKAYKDKRYIERIKFEIDMISKMGYCSYFLIVSDFIRWAKEQGILIGPGRGSAVGSLVSYVLDIVDMDPVDFELYFERFLNPDRVSMPDIDIDIQHNKRDLVISYLKEKYGEESCSKIVTFSTLSFKSAVKDVSRTLEFYSPSDINKITKTLPTIVKNLEEALETPEFKEYYDKEENLRKICEIAKKFNGLPRQASQHACGMIITPGKVSQFVPEKLMTNPETGDKEPTAQFNMVELEEMGLLKMDLLGLRTLTVIADTLEDINGELEKPMTLLDIPIYDKKTYEFIGTGKTVGTFQLESPGMQHLMKELFQNASKEDDEREFFERIIAGISLYRPGPLDYIPDYIKNMRDPSSIIYEHPILKPIIQNTYGVITYQEQVMSIVQQMAGYSLAKADIVRRIMGKKKVEAIEQQGIEFIEGCKNMGIDEEISSKVWEKMVNFAKYAFNRSHSCGYSDISVKTAYLKCHHPIQYMKNVLNSVIDQSDKLKRYLSESKKMNIEILFPDVNKSKEFFSVDGSSIRFGLSAISGVKDLSKNILKEREIASFKSLSDFIGRMSMYKLSSNNVYSLIHSGAFDSLPINDTGSISNRRTKEEHVPMLLDWAKKERFYKKKGIPSIFTGTYKGFRDIKINLFEEYSLAEKLNLEFEANGLYIKSHPVDQYSHLIKSQKLRTIEDITVKAESNIEMGLEVEDEYVNIIGVLREVKARYTKAAGDLMYTMKIEDASGEISAVMFTNEAKKYTQIAENGHLGIFKGRISYSEDFGLQMVIMDHIEPKRTDDKVLTGIDIQIKSYSEYKKAEKDLNIMKDDKGKIDINIFIKGERKGSFKTNSSHLGEISKIFKTDAQQRHN